MPTLFMVGTELSRRKSYQCNNLLVTIPHLKFVLLFPLIIILNPAYGDDTEIQMDWLIEGQIDEQNISEKESKIVSTYEQLIVDSNKQSDPIYDRFITNNQYSIGDYKITIDSEEGQILNGVLIEQRDLRQESFQHKIKYYDRFSDGYVEIAEALLDPIGDNKYIIKGTSYDYNPNSNLELFVLERGYSLDNLDAIPNDIFAPKEFTFGRELIADAQRTGDGVDLRDYSPNHLLLNKEQIKERMTNALSEQTSQVLNDVMTGEKLQDRISSSSRGDMINEPSMSISIFDNFKSELPRFENTRHVHDLLQNSYFKEIPVENFENASLLILIPVFAGLIVFGYMARARFIKRRIKTPLLEITQPQVDYKNITKQMIESALLLYNYNQPKEAFEKLSQAIRYYYSQDLEIYKELTNLELLSVLNDSKYSIYSEAREWLLLCASVEFAKYTSSDMEFKNILSQFSNEVDRK